MKVNGGKEMKRQISMMLGAAGLLALAVTLLIRSISRIRREDLFEKEHLNR